MISEQSTPLLPVAGRVFWMILGPMLLVILTVASFKTGNGWLALGDLIFLVIIAGLVLGRWFEIRGGHPKTSMGEPATPDHFRRYALVVVPLGIVVWVLANVVENHLLTQ